MYAASSSRVKRGRDDEEEEDSDEMESGPEGSESESESGGSDSDVLNPNEDGSSDEDFEGMPDLGLANWTVAGDRKLVIDDFAPGADVPGVNHNLAYDAPVIEYFKLFFGDLFFEQLVFQTNSYASQERAKATAAGKPPKMPWTDTDISEMKAFVGINIRLGVKSSSEIDDIWSTDPLLRDDYLSNIMTRKRYWALSRYIHISDNTDAIRDIRDPRFDPLHKVRDMITLANAKFAEVYKPKQHLSIDEAMIKFKGRHHAVQYMPKKPIKWGFKVWVCAESDTGYCLQFDVYTGKARDPARAAARTEHGLGYDVVATLSQQYQEKNHIISYDRFFSSVALAEFLLRKRTYVNSTVMLNRKGMPTQTRKLQLKKGQPCQQYLKGHLLTTVFFDKRQVCHLSTGCQPGIAVNRVKPIVNDDYNRFMGGVDLCDQNKSYYAVGRKGYKWWKYLFWHMFNLAIINGYIVWRATAVPNDIDPRDLTKRMQYTQRSFRLDIVRQLAGGYDATIRKVAKRRASFEGPKMDPLSIITHLAEDGPKRACRFCSSKGVKTVKGGQVRSNTRCAKCDVTLCAQGCFQKYHAELCGISIP